MSREPKNYKVYRLYIDLGRDGALAERLDRIPRPLRGEYIRMALRHFMESGEGISPVIQPKRGSKEELAKTYETIFGQ